MLMGDGTLVALADTYIINIIDKSTVANLIPITAMR